jgi:hypothetical protein
MAELTLTLTAEEHQFLVGLLELTEKNTLVEEHRTRVLSYRQDILHREELIAALLAKLRQAGESRGLPAAAVQTPATGVRPSSG